MRLPPKDSNPSASSRGFLFGGNKVKEEEATTTETGVTAPPSNPTEAVSEPPAMNEEAVEANQEEKESAPPEEEVVATKEEEETPSAATEPPAVEETAPTSTDPPEDSSAPTPLLVTEESSATSPESPPPVTSKRGSVRDMLKQYQSLKDIKSSSRTMASAEGTATAGPPAVIEENSSKDLDQSEPAETPQTVDETAEGTGWVPKVQDEDATETKELAVQEGAEKPIEPSLSAEDQEKDESWAPPVVPIVAPSGGESEAKAEEQNPRESYYEEEVVVDEDEEDVVEEVIDEEYAEEEEIEVFEDDVAEDEQGAVGGSEAPDDIETGKAVAPIRSASKKKQPSEPTQTHQPKQSQSKADAPPTVTRSAGEGQTSSNSVTKKPGYTRPLTVLGCAIVLLIPILLIIFLVGGNDNDSGDNNSTTSGETSRSPPTLSPGSENPGQPTVAPPSGDPTVPTELSPTPVPTPGETPPPTTLRMGQFVSNFLIPVSGEEVFQDPSSPQYQAALYMADFDDQIDQLQGLGHLADRYAATTFYFATGGDSWDSCFLGDTSCDEPDDGPWLTGDICTWRSVSCNGEGRVTSISFGEYGATCRLKRRKLFSCRM